MHGGVWRQYGRVVTEIYRDALSNLKCWYVLLSILLVGHLRHIVSVSDTSTYLFIYYLIIFLIDDLCMYIYLFVKCRNPDWITCIYKVFITRQLSIYIHVLIYILTPDI